MDGMRQTKAHAMSFLAGVLVAGAGHAQAQARLECLVTYAGASQQVLAQPVDSPYDVPTIDIGGRFDFKAVLVGQGEDVRRAVVYVYLQTARQPVLIQQATYLPPYRGPVSSVAADAPIDLTGRQHLYAGTQERELIYNCTLRGARP